MGMLGFDHEAGAHNQRASYPLEESYRLYYDPTAGGRVTENLWGYDSGTCSHMAFRQTSQNGASGSIPKSVVRLSGKEQRRRKTKNFTDSTQVHLAR